MKKSFYAAVVTVFTLSSQNLYAIDAYCSYEAQQAAEAIHEINSPGSQAKADRVEATEYAGWHTKKYEIKIEDKSYSVNMFEYETAATPGCEVILVQKN